MSISIDEKPKKKQMIFKSRGDATRAIILTFFIFLVVGYQAFVYGMLTIPMSEHFHIPQSRLIFYDSFGMWGQLIAMFISGFLISRIKGVNTILLGAVIMLVVQLLSVYAPNIELYTLCTFFTNVAVGFMLMPCTYLIAGSVEEEGKNQGLLSIVNVFFSIGATLSPFFTGLLIAKVSWEAVFFLNVILFMLVILVIFTLKIREYYEHEVNAMQAAAKQEKPAAGMQFITLPFVLTGLALFLMMYVEQIINYFFQPYLHSNMQISIESVGAIMMMYAIGQAGGRLLFGKFLLPKIKIYKYIMTATILFMLLLVVFLQLKTYLAFMVIGIVLGLADSCLYPSIYGYGIDQLDGTNSKAISILGCSGVLGIPFGTGISGLIGEHFDKTTAIAIAPVLLLVICILIFWIHKLRSQRAQSGAQEITAVASI
ncbi:MFS transporter [Dongshaea marina]|uniref:MFS transporter n=1 Tax=Dongshaea marina TaxID=2047966 RepID=UPI000D3E3680|nr:MFS transporter [Dongshaea marina]